MIRLIAIALVVGAALGSASATNTAEIFPVVHHEPITVRILGGKDGRPLPHVHLILLGGYNSLDLSEQAWREELLTDERGQARLSGQLANLPWLQVWVTKKTLCQVNPRTTSFSVELIRRDGLSTPNRCGLAVVEDSPGTFTVFVKGKGKFVAELTSAGNQIQTNRLMAAQASAPAPASAPDSAPASVPVTTDANASQPGMDFVATESAAFASAGVVQSNKVVQTGTLDEAFIAMPFFRDVPAKVVLLTPTKPHIMKKVAHKPAPVVAVCQAQPPVAKMTLASLPVKHTTATDVEKVPSLGHKSKPTAGHKPTASKPKEPVAPAPTTPK
jgi:hypothetical protein